MKKKIIETIDCTPDWRPIVETFLRRIEEMNKYEEHNRKLCTDYEGALESYRCVILDCASKLDNLNKVLKVKDAYIKQLLNRYPQDQILEESEVA